MQRRATIQILGIFYISPSFGIEAITGLILIHLHLQKLSGKLQLRAHSLLYNHILRSLLKIRQLSFNIPYQLLLDILIPFQCSKIKESIVNIDNRFNKVFFSFDLFNKEFALESQLINIFSSHFVFHLSNKQSSNNLKSYIHLLDNIVLKSFLDPTVTLVIANTSIKNNIATSISHIYIYNKLVIKTFYHTVNVITTEAKLFTIRCSIN